MFGAVGVFGTDGFSSLKTGSAGTSVFSFFAIVSAEVESLTSH
jgi:hypothetical protein